MKQAGSPSASYTGIYGMHKYWSKKPYGIIRELIKEYSKPGNIVMDPFCGSGITLVESIISGRKAIGIDINPSALLIARQILVSHDLNEIEKEFRKLEHACKDQINAFYEVKRKNRTFTGTHFVWSNADLLEVRYHDPQHRNSIISKPTHIDRKLAKSFAYSKIEHYFPTQVLLSNARINVNSQLRVCDLFTPRNTHALSLLLFHIYKIQNKELRDLFKFCFTASLGQCSKMVFVINSHMINGKKEKLPYRRIGSWVIGYWMPDENFELNVWNCFLNRYKKMISAKSQNILYKANFVSNFNGLRKGNVLMINDSALNYLKKFRDNSIDYILTDPPHGDRIPYLELSAMWNNWLKEKVNYKDELVISGAISRQKDINNYRDILVKTVKQLVRILKPNKYLTFIFHTHDYHAWNELLNILKKSGLRIYDISALNYSHHSVVQKNKEGGLKYDFILTFKKH